jgi:hypothetical protein
MLNGRPRGWRWIPEAMGKGCLYGQNLSEVCQGFGLGVRKTREARGSRKRTKAGMSLKRKDMPICDRPIKILGRIPPSYPWMLPNPSITAGANREGVCQH